jgi:hypothetical protein
MLISYMTKMMLLFSVIIAVGLFLTWVNDRLERFLTRLLRPRSPHPVKVTFASLQSRSLTQAVARPRVKTVSIPKPTKLASLNAVQQDQIGKHDYAGKIVKLDLAPRSRVSQAETGEKLGEHVTVLAKAA